MSNTFVGLVAAVGGCACIAAVAVPHMGIRLEPAAAPISAPTRALNAGSNAQPAPATEEPAANDAEEAAGEPRSDDGPPPPGRRAEDADRRQRLQAMQLQRQRLESQVLDRLSGDQRALVEQMLQAERAELARRSR